MLVSGSWLKSNILRVKQYVNPWYKPSNLHKKIADIVTNPKNKNIILVVPPQFGKTELVSVTLPAYLLGQDPTDTIILGTYNQDFANKLSTKFADFFTNPKYKSLFGIKPHPEMWNKNERLLYDNPGGCIFAGVGGKITGNPGNRLLLDDLTKDYEDAMSKIKQESIWNWYKTVVGTRLQGEDSSTIITMTRWIKNDLIGKILKDQDEESTPDDELFKIYHFAALYDAKTNGPASKELLEEIIKHKDGKLNHLVYSLWPERKSVKFLLGRFRKGQSEFMTMYQGNPKDLDGLVIDKKWIRFENDIKSLGDLKYSCRGWDFGYTEGGDYTVGSKIDVYKKGDLITPILSDVVSFRLNPSEAKERIVETALKDGEDVVIALETGGTQIAMSSDVMNREELFNHRFNLITPKGDKVSRAMPWIFKLENGMLRLAIGKWNKEVVDSFVDFSKDCEHDDIEDSITTAWITLFGSAL